LRTYNKQAPFPEINRQITSRIVDMHLRHKTSNKNLLNEGISSNSIVETGNTSDACYGRLVS
jgi:UDP-N-acetylglucosamine 2-epimerase